MLPEKNDGSHQGSHLPTPSFTQPSPQCHPDRSRGTCCLPACPYEESYPSLAKKFSTLRTYTSAKSATGRFSSINCIASSTLILSILHKTARAIIGARCTPAAQWMYTFASNFSSAASAKSTPSRNNSAGLGSKSSCVGFSSTSIPCFFPNSVSSHSSCMLMMCVIPSSFSCAILSSECQIPPPSAIRSVNQVI